MIILAVILIVLGLASMGYGNNIDGSIKNKLSELLSGSAITVEPQNLVFMIIGTILVVAGIILIVVKVSKQKKT